MVKYIKSGLHYSKYITPFIADELERLSKTERYDWVTVAKDKEFYHDTLDNNGDVLDREALLDVLRDANDSNVSYRYDVIINGHKATMCKELICYNDLVPSDIAHYIALTNLADELPNVIPTIDDSGQADDSITTAEAEDIERRAREIVAFALDVSNNSLDYSAAKLDFDDLSVRVCQIPSEEEADGGQYDPLWSIVNDAVDHYCNGTQGLQARYDNGKTRGSIIYNADGDCISHSDAGFEYVCAIFDDAEAVFTFSPMTAEELDTY